MQLAIVIT